MPILLKRSYNTGSIPTTASLAAGEVAVNVPDGRMYIRQSGSLGDTVRSIPVLGVQNSGSLILTGSITTTQGVTGSLFGTASVATTSSFTVTASFALNASAGGSGAGFPYSGSGVITGSLLISGSSTSSIFDVYKSGSRVINIEGSQGQLFSVTDSLSGSLMSVNDITGLPILEVFSDDRVVMGSFGRNTLVVSGSSVTVSGSMVMANQFVLPLTSSSSPQTGSMFFSGSFIYVYDGTKYRSASLN